MANSNCSELAMESNVLMRRAAWCGIVFALAIVLTFLNFMPPVNVKYHVRTKMVVSESRLAKLRELAMADRMAVKQSVAKDILLLSVKVLDLAEQEHSAGSDPTDEKVVLLEVGTLWNGRCTPERHYQWLNDISKIAPNELAQASAARAMRIARWELQAAEHYQSQFDFLAAKEVLPPETTVVNHTESLNDAVHSSANAVVTSSAETAKPRSFRLANYTEASSTDMSTPKLPTVGHSAPASATDISTLASLASVQQTDPGQTAAEDDQQFEQQLMAQVNLAKQRFQQAEMDWMAEIDRSSGTLQIASVPVIAPRSTSIPFWMAASILVLGLATASTVGWCQHRGHSGGTFHARQVADQLALHSLPTAGRLVLCKLEHESTISRAGRLSVARVGQYLTRLGDWGLTFWVAIAVSRFFLDAAWRDVLINSPLAAFGRLLAGMP